MHIPVGYHASAIAKRRGSFSCPHCKHWQRAEVTGIGGGGSSLLFGGELAEERAKTNAARNADRMLRFATCPKCKQRSGLGAFVGRQALMFVTIVALIGVLCLVFPVFDKSMDAADAHVMRTWMQLILDGVLLLAVVWHSTSEWRRLDRRVRWLDF